MTTFKCIKTSYTKQKMFSSEEIKYNITIDKLYQTVFQGYARGVEALFLIKDDNNNHRWIRLEPFLEMFELINPGGL